MLFVFLLPLMLVNKDYQKHSLERTSLISVKQPMKRWSWVLGRR